MDLQPYSHYCFSKILRTLFDFLNNTYWVSLFQRNSSLIFWTGVSCFSVALFYSALFCCGGKANLVRFTLFYSTLLTLTDRQTDGQRKEYTCFAWAGGTCPCFAWAGGTLFPVVLLFQFFVLAGNRFWFYILMYLEYHTVVVLCQFFWFWREIVFGVSYVLLVYYTVVRLCHFFCCGGKVKYFTVTIVSQKYQELSL